MNFAKIVDILVADEDRNVHNASGVLFRLGANTDPHALLDTALAGIMMPA